MECFYGRIAIFEVNLNEFCVLNFQQVNKVQFYG